MKFLISVVLVLAILGTVIATVKFLVATIGLVLLLLALAALLSFVVNGLKG